MYRKDQDLAGKIGFVEMCIRDRYFKQGITQKNVRISVVLKEVFMVMSDQILIELNLYSEDVWL